MPRRFEPYTLSILRIIISFTFVLHGGQKLLGWFGGLGGHPAPYLSKMWMAGVIEVAGGSLMMLGLLVSPVAFILCGEMAVAYFTQHAPRGFWPIENQGELAVLYCFIFLYLSTTDGGAWSLDRVRRRRN
jgi:putative oxidoreductase